MVVVNVQRSPMYRRPSMVWLEVSSPRIRQVMDDAVSQETHSLPRLPVTVGAKQCIINYIYSRQDRRHIRAKESRIKKCVTSVALRNRLQANCPLDTSKYSVLPAAIWRNYDASSTLIQYYIYTQHSANIWHNFYLTIRQPAVWQKL